jgi:hypothetical protein
MTPEEKYKVKKRKEFLDEKYLEKQLRNIAENKIEISLRVKHLKTKLSTKSVNPTKIFITERQVIKLFEINSRTALLLRNNGYIRFFVLSGNIFYKLIDIQTFLKFI